MNVKKLTTLAMLTAISMIVFLIEAQIPLPFADPGVKLGIVTPDADHGFTGESVAHARAEAQKPQRQEGMRVHHGHRPGPDAQHDILWQQR